ncbi:hypothetical protein H6P81_011145 [Aristolochia fimbriata]|uniref:Transcription factor CBF/NF-Y/archaeal histone domain-containing protein n=1 Tax=Aristolochia fimbriata TaxID=158543 RepID=A0AAV7ESV9_ARIFI|nr:hypothetical protein H6P81_011145 [Aristolochia fimbriata]
MRGPSRSTRNGSPEEQGSPPSDTDSSSRLLATKEQDRFLPIANVSRIMKKSLPPNAKISKEAKETVQECVSEFISFVTGEASDKCQREKRKTINGDDLLWAMTTLGFDDYVGPLKGYLNRYRDTEGEKNPPPGADDPLINNCNGTTTVTASSVSSSGFNGGFGYGGGVLVGYGENSKMGSFHNIGEPADHGVQNW